MAGPFVLALNIGLPLAAGTVQTLDGKSYAGRMGLSEAMLVVATSNGVEVRVEATNLAQVIFDAPAAAAVAHGALPKVWTSRDVGDVGNNLFVGLAVTSQTNFALCSATFDDLKLTMNGLKIETNAGEASGTDPSATAWTPAAKGILLSNGSFYAGDIRFADDTTVRLAHRGKEVSVPTRRVAQLIVCPVPPGAAGGVGAARTGAVLSNGDFLDGDFKLMEGKIIKVSSVLFGLRRFNTDSKEVVSVVLRAAATATPACEVRTTDGSVFRTKSFELHPDTAVLEDPGTGPVTIPTGELLEIRRLGR